MGDSYVSKDCCGSSDLNYSLPIFFGFLERTKSSMDSLESKPATEEESAFVDSLK